MSKLSQEKLIQFANELELLDNKKKDLMKDIKDYTDGFCEENEIKSKKQLKAAVKAYLSWKKDRAKFLDDIRAFDEFIDVLTGEKCVETISEEEARA
jgi:uncharacterized protein (UPF0335 family)